MSTAPAHRVTCEPPGMTRVGTAALWSSPRHQPQSPGHSSLGLCCLQLDNHLKIKPWACLGNGTGRLLGASWFFWTPNALHSMTLEVVNVRDTCVHLQLCWLGWEFCLARASVSPHGKQEIAWCQKVLQVAMAKDLRGAPTWAVGPRCWAAGF